MWITVYVQDSVLRLLSDKPHVCGVCSHLQLRYQKCLDARPPSLASCLPTPPADSVARRVKKGVQSLLGSFKSYRSGSQSPWVRARIPIKHKLHHRSPYSLSHVNVLSYYPATDSPYNCFFCLCASWVRGVVCGVNVCQIKLNFSFFSPLLSVRISNFHLQTEEASYMNWVFCTGFSMFVF